MPQARFHCNAFQYETFGQTCARSWSERSELGGCSVINCGITYRPLRALSVFCISYLLIPKYTGIISSFIQWPAFSLKEGVLDFAISLSEGLRAAVRETTSLMHDYIAPTSALRGLQETRYLSLSASSTPNGYHSHCLYISWLRFCMSSLIAIVRLCWLGG